MHTLLEKQLHRISKQQRNRLWAQHIIQRIYPVFFYTTLCFFTAGIIHQFIQPLKLLPVSMLALIPLLIIFVWLAIRQKPSLNEGAARADRLLRAHSLFISAWELSHTISTINSTGKLLLNRAEKQHTQWSKQIQQQPSSNLPISVTGFITMSLIGIFLLLQPAQVDFNNTSSFIETNEPASSTVNRDDSVDVLRELLSNNMNSSVTPDQQERKPQQRGDIADRSTSGTKTAQNQQPATADSTPDTKTDKTAASGLQALTQAVMPTASAQAMPSNEEHSESYKTADGSAGNNAPESATKKLAEADEFERIQTIDIDTGTDNQSMSRDNLTQSVELITTAEITSNTQLVAQANTKRTLNSSVTAILSAQQRYLVSRYFNHLEKIDDPNQ